MEYDEHGVGHCYDNVFADMYLHGGKDQEGIYKYIDVFTPGGYISMFIFAAIRSAFNELVFNLATGIVMAIVYYNTRTTIDLCNSTDTYMTFFGWNACNSFWDSTA